MKILSWEIKLGISLIVFSVFVYLFHYFIFRDPHHIFIYLIGDLGFVFIEVLLVTLIIHQLLSEREKNTRLEKLNMVIGTFYSEVGTKLLAYFSDFDPELDEIRKRLIVTQNWCEEDFSKLRNQINNCNFSVEIRKINLEDLRGFMGEKLDFLLRLLENPNLLEHESFTELLRAVFHLAEELSYRETLSALPDTDYDHLAGDIQRAYTLCVSQWLDYMKHLKENYPYLCSLAMRTNPFDKNATPIVT